jgi:uncharacterized protein YkwD
VATDTSASFRHLKHHLVRLVRGLYGSRAALAALLALTLASAVGLLSAPRAGARSAGVYERHWLEDQLMEAVASVRTQHGLAPLEANGELAAAAQQHTIEMVRDGYFEHNGVSLSYARRLQNYYPRLGPRRPWRVGEILAWGSPSISAGLALTLWLHSPEHRATLLSRWRDIGISAFHSSNAPGIFQGLDVTVITIDFGQR